jgi:predicted Zn-dependent protease with MMP-like domain
MEAPDHVFLFRRPLLDEWADNGEITLEELIRHVLIHEIGHHFGLSDEAMHAVEESA